MSASFNRDDESLIGYTQPRPIQAFTDAMPACMQEYDAVLAQGAAAQWVADAAAEAGVPLIRFPGPGVNGGQDFIDPLMERPDVIVESQWRSSGAPRPAHYLEAEIMQLAPGASSGAHDGLASMIKVQQL